MSKQQRKGYFTAQERAFVRAVAPYVTARQLALALGRDRQLTSSNIYRQGVRLARSKQHQLSDAAVNVAWKKFRRSERLGPELFAIPERELTARPHRRWSDAENSELRTYPGTMPLALIAHEMGRTVCAIKEQLRVMGLMAEHYRCSLPNLHRGLLAKGVRCNADSLRKIVKPHVHWWREANVVLLHPADFDWVLEHYVPYQAIDWAALAAARGGE